MAQLNFDATQVAPDTGFDTVPAGWYNVMIDESEMKPTRSGDGAYLQIRFNILDGQYANRKLFARVNLRNANPVAQEIGFKQLSAIAHAVGVLHIQDSSQLHGIPLKVKVKIRTDKTGEYEDQNEITTYKNINEQVSGGVAPAGGGVPAGFGPPAAAPVQPQAQPAAWQQPAAQQPPQAPAAWQQPPQATQAPMQQPAPAQPAQQAWAPPAQAQQPWAQPPVQPQAQPGAPAAPPAAAPGGFNPQAAVPPWAQGRQ